MVKEVRIFEDLHALAHRWVQYASEDYSISFEEFLKNKEPSRHQRLYNLFCFAQEQGAKPVDSKQDKVSLEGETIKEIVADYGSEVMALVQKGKLERLPELTEGATKEILARIEKQFIWGQVPYHDIESGTTKEWTMRCISDEDWQDLSKEK